MYKNVHSGMHDFSHVMLWKMIKLLELCVPVLMYMYMYMHMYKHSIACVE